MSKQPVVIIGSGLAGYTVAREFRKLDAETPVVILSADHGGFYSKPMLSNAFAQKKTPDALLMKSAAQMSSELNVDVRGQSRVGAIDPKRKEITVNGEVMMYGQLVLAIGADPIHLPLKGSGADAVLSVNDLDDYRSFRTAIEGKKSVVILGAGLIGCEFANDMASAGYQIHVIDLAPQLLGRLLPSQSAAFMQKKLEAAGITFHLATSILEVDRLEGNFRVKLDNGETIDADAVLSAVGLKPRTDLAKAAGVNVNRGIAVNSLLQTNFEDIYALGDCAEVVGKVLPFVMPIMHAARALASTLTGKSTQVSYPAMPVAVKTPACPAVVAPPEPGLKGNWQVEETADGVKATFLSEQDSALLGFALLGVAVSEKNYLVQRL